MQAASLFERVVNSFVFGGFIILAVASNFTEERPHSISGVIVLSATAIVGYASTTSRHLSRVWGVAAFFAGWFVNPWAGLALIIVATAIGSAQTRARTEVGEQGDNATGGTGSVRNDSLASQPSSVLNNVDTAPPDSQKGSNLGAERAIARQLATLRVATELKDTVAQLGAEFHSPYGDGLIPVLLENGGHQRALYVEAGEWDEVKQRQALQWLGLLRTSDREDLEVQFSSDHPVPPVVTFYASQEPRTLFELVGLLNYRWKETQDFAEANSLTFKRLANEYFELTFSDDIESLGELDQFVLQILRTDSEVAHILTPTIILMGSYLGEVMRKQCPGRWVTLPEPLGETELEDTVVELRSEVGSAKVNVFGKIRKLFFNGIQDSTEHMARVILERIGVTPK